MSHGPPSTPSAEVTIGARLVAELLEDQHPDLANLPLSLLEQGWDNVMFRLGSELTVRLPRRAMAAALIEHEQRWLPSLAPRLPLPIPVRCGVQRQLRASPTGSSRCGAVRSRPELPGY